MKELFRLGRLIVGWQTPEEPSEPATVVETVDTSIPSGIVTYDDEGRKVRIDKFTEGGITYTMLEGYPFKRHKDWGFAEMFKPFPAILPEIAEARKHFYELQATRRKVTRLVERSKFSTYNRETNQLEDPD